MTIKQIAERYGVSETTARRRLAPVVDYKIVTVKAGPHDPARQVRDYKLKTIAPLFKPAKKPAKVATTKKPIAKKAKG